MFLITKATLLAAILSLIAWTLLKSGRESRGGLLRAISRGRCECILITQCPNPGAVVRQRGCGFQGLQRKICCDSNSTQPQNRFQAMLAKAINETAQRQALASQFYRNDSIFANEKLPMPQTTPTPVQTPPPSILYEHFDPGGYIRQKTELEQRRLNGESNTKHLNTKEQFQTTTQQPDLPNLSPDSLNSPRLNSKDSQIQGQMINPQDIQNAPDTEQVELAGEELNGNSNPTESVQRGKTDLEENLTNGISTPDATDGSKMNTKAETTTTEKSIESDWKERAIGNDENDNYNTAKNTERALEIDQNTSSETLNLKESDSYSEEFDESSQPSKQNVTGEAETEKEESLDGGKSQETLKNETRKNPEKSENFKILEPGDSLNQSMDKTSHTHTKVNDSEVHVTETPELNVKETTIGESNYDVNEESEEISIGTTTERVMLAEEQEVVENSSDSVNGSTNNSTMPGNRLESKRLLNIEGTGGGTNYDSQSVTEPPQSQLSNSDSEEKSDDPINMENSFESSKNSSSPVQNTTSHGNEIPESSKSEGTAEPSMVNWNQGKDRSKTSAMQTNHPKPSHNNSSNNILNNSGKNSPEEIAQPSTTNSAIFDSDAGVTTTSTPSPTFVNHPLSRKLSSSQNDEILSTTTKKSNDNDKETTTPTYTDLGSTFRESEGETTTFSTPTELPSFKLTEEFDKHGHHKGFIVNANGSLTNNSSLSSPDTNYGKTTTILNDDVDTTTVKMNLMFDEFSLKSSSQMSDKPTSKTATPNTEIEMESTTPTIVSGTVRKPEALNSTFDEFSREKSEQGTVISNDNVPTTTSRDVSVNEPTFLSDDGVNETTTFISAFPTTTSSPSPSFVIHPLSKSSDKPNSAESLVNKSSLQAIDEHWDDSFNELFPPSKPKPGQSVLLHIDSANETHRENKSTTPLTTQSEEITEELASSNNSTTINPQMEDATDFNMPSTTPQLSHENLWDFTTTMSPSATDLEDTSTPTPIDRRIDLDTATGTTTIYARAYDETSSPSPITTTNFFYEKNPTSSKKISDNKNDDRDITTTTSKSSESGKSWETSISTIDTERSVFETTTTSSSLSNGGNYYETQDTTPMGITSTAIPYSSEDQRNISTGEWMKLQNNVSSQIPSADDSVSENILNTTPNVDMVGENKEIDTTTANGKEEEITSVPKDVIISDQDVNEVQREAGKSLTIVETNSSHSSYLNTPANNNNNNTDHENSPPPEVKLDEAGKVDSESTTANALAKTNSEQITTATPEPNKTANIDDESSTIAIATTPTSIAMNDDQQTDGVPSKGSVKVDKTMENLENNDATSSTDNFHSTPSWLDDSIEDGTTTMQPLYHNPSSFILNITEIFVSSTTPKSIPPVISPGPDVVNNSQRLNFEQLKNTLEQVSETTGPDSTNSFTGDTENSAETTAIPNVHEADKNNKLNINPTISETTMTTANLIDSTTIVAVTTKPLTDERNEETETPTTLKPMDLEIVSTTENLNYSDISSSTVIPQDSRGKNIHTQEGESFNALDEGNREIPTTTTHDNLGNSTEVELHLTENEKNSQNFTPTTTISPDIDQEFLTSLVTGSGKLAHRLTSTSSWTSDSLPEVSTTPASKSKNDKVTEKQLVDSTEETTPTTNLHLESTLRVNEGETTTLSMPKEAFTYKLTQSIEQDGHHDIKNDDSSENLANNIVESSAEEKEQPSTTNSAILDSDAVVTTTSTPSPTFVNHPLSRKLSSSQNDEILSTTTKKSNDNDKETTTPTYTDLGSTFRESEGETTTFSTPTELPSFKLTEEFDKHGHHKGFIVNANGSLTNNSSLSSPDTNYGKTTTILNDDVDTTTVKMTLMSNEFSLKSTSQMSDKPISKTATLNTEIEIESTTPTISTETEGEPLELSLKSNSTMLPTFISEGGANESTSTTLGSNQETSTMSDVLVTIIPTTGDGNFISNSTARNNYPSTIPINSQGLEDVTSTENTGQETTTVSTVDLEISTLPFDAEFFTATSSLDGTNSKNSIEATTIEINAMKTSTEYDSSALKQLNNEDAQSLKSENTKSPTFDHSMEETTTAKIGITDNSMVNNDQVIVPEQRQSKALKFLEEATDTPMNTNIETTTFIPNDVTTLNGNENNQKIQNSTTNDVETKMSGDDNTILETSTATPEFSYIASISKSTRNSSHSEVSNSFSLSKSSNSSQYFTNTSKTSNLSITTTRTRDGESDDTELEETVASETEASLAFETSTVFPSTTSNNNINNLFDFTESPDSNSDQFTTTQTSQLMDDMKDSTVVTLDKSYKTDSPTTSYPESLNDHGEIFTRTTESNLQFDSTTTQFISSEDTENTTDKTSTESESTTLTSTQAGNSSSINVEREENTTVIPTVTPNSLGKTTANYASSIEDEDIISTETTESQSPSSTLSSMLEDEFLDGTTTPMEVIRQLPHEISTTPYNNELADSEMNTEDPENQLLETTTFSASGLTLNHLADETETGNMENISYARNGSDEETTTSPFTVEPDKNSSSSSINSSSEQNVTEITTMSPPLDLENYVTDDNVESTTMHQYETTEEDGIDQWTISSFEENDSSAKKLDLERRAGKAIESVTFPGTASNSLKQEGSTERSSTTQDSSTYSSQVLEEFTEGAVRYHAVTTSDYKDEHWDPSYNQLFPSNSKGHGSRRKPNLILHVDTQKELETLKKGSKGDPLIKLEIRAKSRALSNNDAVNLARRLGSQVSSVVGQLLLTSHANFHLLPGFTQCATYHRNRNPRKLPEFGLQNHHLPHLLRIGFKEPGGVVYSCAGTLISRQYVLTSAACLQNNYFNISSVLAEWEGQKEYLDVDQVILHEGFSNKTMQNDIALLRLSQKVAEDVRPICLPFEDAYGVWEKVRAKPGNSAIESGWMTTQTHSHSNSTSLNPQSLASNETYVKILPNSRCEKIFGHKLADSQICTEGSGSVLDDRGSPLSTLQTRHQLYIQIGLLSHFNPQGRIHTRLAFFLPWILDNLKP